ncbi:hypothetical protein H5410_007078 [Solanum commersonii]|uniref:Uncharacterized protein n=1 Tax=Solanum commersonii TaxID=4109 RepID=A0A9J6AC17_SOLCO|nr:hypothetical protein H5410_007078 [Solanum commersonii]
MERIELNSATASDMTKTLNALNSSNIGIPVSLLLPPGTVKPAAKTIVAIKVATIIQEFAVSFIHLSPSFSSSSKSSGSIRVISFSTNPVLPANVAS